LSIDLTDGIEPGNLKLKVLTTNEVSATLPSSPQFAGIVKQPGAAAAQLLAEHGLSVFVEVKNGEETHAFLFDTGGMNASIIHNMNAMGIKWNQIEKVIISHGHFDHTGSLIKVLPELSEGSEVVIHPDAYLQNEMVVTSTREEIPLDDFANAIKEFKKEGKLLADTKLPQLNQDMTTKAANDHGIKLNETTQPEILYPGIATSGEIELFDDAEVTHGFYLLKSKTEVEKQSFRDEIALIFNIKEKGLVILTGCGHTGIINIIRHAQKITGIDTIYAVIGGFHEEMAPPAKIDNVIQQLDEFNPQLVCGMHCTGMLFNYKMMDHPSRVQGVTGTEFTF
jgi:7,8-dihydropterin-6-yl-methyl-4-(beta-D-ribofuranosyl)aminobenzene 5'-phosphate synthase